MARHIINGTDKADFLNGYERAVEIFGKGGADEISGSRFSDIIHGGKGNDFIFADPGNDTVFGDAGNDTLDGSDGSDRVNGGEGNDYLSALFGPESDRDTLSGGNGSDILEFDSHTHAIGGAGADLFAILPSLKISGETQTTIPVVDAIVNDFQDGLDKLAISSGSALTLTDFTVQRVDADTIRVKLYGDGFPGSGIPDHSLAGTITLNDFHGTITASDFVVF